MKTVVICGSSRFSLEMEEFAKKLKDFGVVVFCPYLYRKSSGNWGIISDYDKQLVVAGLTHDHFYKIRMADIVYIFNKDGYVGISTNLEIGYAAALNKPIYAFSRSDNELCRKTIFSGFIETAEDLIKYL